MIQDLKFLMQKSPSYMIFWVAQACNFTCEHCFNYLENKKKQADLSLEEIDLFTKNMEHIKYVTLAGGEPFVRKDMAEITKLFYKNNGLQICNIVTNGWFEDRTVEYAKQVLNDCPDLNIMISISIDGMEDVHDKIRQKKGSFQRCLKTVKSLQDLKKNDTNGDRLAVTTTGVYSRENAETILDLARYLVDEVDVPFFMNLIRGEDIQNNEYKKVDVEHYHQTYDELTLMNNEKFSENYPFRNVKLGVNKVVSEIILDSALNDKMTVPCKAGEKGFVLTANGDVLLCEILNIRLGNIRENGYKPLDILNSSQAHDEIKKIKQGRCHCTWECFQSVNTVFSPSLYPRVFKHAALYKFGKKKSERKNIPAPNYEKNNFRSNALLKK